jgi:serine protease inhibitor
MNDFTQSIMTEMWNEEGPNFVFSPFSLHTALAILTTGSTENSKTENELLDALGRVRNIQALEMRYQKLLKEYQTTDVNTLLSFGTKLWTAKRYFDNIRGSFLEKLSAIYDIEFSLIKTKNPERDINRWVREITHGKIDKIVGMSLLLFLLSRMDI